MAKTITLREANQAFSRLSARSRRARRFTITRDGEPVARLVPVRRERVLTPEQEAARARALERMKKGWHLGGERFNRDELYDEIVGRHAGSGAASPRFTLDANLLVYSVDLDAGDTASPCPPYRSHSSRS